MVKLTAYKIYLLLVGCQSLAFWAIFTVNLVYHATTVGMNPLQLTLVGTALEIAILLGELPTGLLADLYSRRLSVIIGLFLMGIGFLVEGSFPTFTMVLVATIMAINGVQVLALMLFGLTNAFGIALLAYWTVVTLGAINRPLYLTWVNQQAEPQVRATLFSFMGQTDAVGQLIGGPITGAMGTLLSLRSALVTTGLLLSPVLWLESRALKKQPVAQITVEKE